MATRLNQKVLDSIKRLVKNKETNKFICDLHKISSTTLRRIMQANFKLSEYQTLVKRESSPAHEPAPKEIQVHIDPEQLALRMVAHVKNSMDFPGLVKVLADEINGQVRATVYGIVIGTIFASVLLMTLWHFVMR